MKKNIEDYIGHFKGIIPKYFCETLMNELDNQNRWEKFQWNNNWEKTDEDEESPLYKTFSDNDEFLDNATKQMFQDYINTFNLPWFKPEPLRTSVIQYNKYLPGAKLENHCDHIHSLFDGTRQGVPILSMVGILNDDYEGGEMIFCDDVHMDLKQGDVIIFPSIFLYPHTVETITKGNRYSFVRWGW